MAMNDFMKYDFNIEKILLACYVGRGIKKKPGFVRKIIKYRLFGGLLRKPHGSAGYKSFGNFV